MLAGCAGVRSGAVLPPPRPDAPWQAPAASAAEAQAVTPPAGFVLPPNPALAELPPTPEIDPQHHYTLPELIDLAQRHHPQTRIAWNEARNAALTAGTARSSWQPQLSATVLAGTQYRRSRDNDSLLGLSDRSDGRGTLGLLSLQWLLFDFGERNALAEAADQGTVVAGIGFTAVHQQIIEAVSLAYYAHGAALARVTVARRTLANSRDVLQAAQGQRKQGVGTEISVAQARQGAAQAQLAVVQAEGALRDAYHTLIAAMGIAPLATLQLAELPTPALDRAAEAPVERIVAEALARRPDIQAAYATLRASQAGAQAAAAAQRPKVFLSASLSRGTGRAGINTQSAVGGQLPALNLSGTGTGAGLFVGVTVPIFDAGVRESALAQARQRSDIAQDRLERVRQQAVQQIVHAQDALRTALATAEAAQTLQSTTAITYDAALDAYRHGVGTVTAVALANTQLLQAGQAVADARAAVQSAAVTLAFATGALGSVPP